MIYKKFNWLKISDQDFFEWLEENDIGYFEESGHNCVYYYILKNDFDYLVCDFYYGQMFAFSLINKKDTTVWINIFFIDYFLWKIKKILKRYWKMIKNKLT